MSTKELNDKLESLFSKMLVTYKITLLGKSYACWDKERLHATYGHELELVRNGHTERFTFYDSIHNTEKNIKPLLISILACLEWVDPGNFDDWCSECDYDSDSISHFEIYRKVLAEFKQLRNLFGPSEREAIYDIVSEY